MLSNLSEAIEAPNGPSRLVGPNAVGARERRPLNRLRDLADSGAGVAGFVANRPARERRSSPVVVPARRPNVPEIANPTSARPLLERPDGITIPADAVPRHALLRDGGDRRHADSAVRAEVVAGLEHRGDHASLLSVGRHMLDGDPAPTALDPADLPIPEGVELGAVMLVELAQRPAPRELPQAVAMLSQAPMLLPRHRRRVAPAVVVVGALHDVARSLDVRGRCAAVAGPGVRQARRERYRLD